MGFKQNYKQINLKYVEILSHQAVPALKRLCCLEWPWFEGRSNSEWNLHILNTDQRIWGSGCKGPRTRQEPQASYSSLRAPDVFRYSNSKVVYRNII